MLKRRSLLKGLGAFRATPLLGAADEAAGPAQLSLDGNDWLLASLAARQGERGRVFAEDFPTGKAIPGSVPGDVYGDLERAGKLPSIYYGENSQRLAWVAGREWWYRKSFAVPGGWNRKIVRLRFAGVDYLADVWLNGQPLGRHEGQFTPFEFDVSEHLRYGHENVLTVRIHAAPPSVRKELVATPGKEWPLMQAMRAAYPFWKSMTNSGWDWGTPLITMGIWKPVRLIASNGIWLSELVVLPALPPPYGSALLRVRVRVNAKAPARVKLACESRCLTAPAPGARAERAVDIASGGQDATLELKIDQPRLWWPNGYGPQNLYELSLTARPERGGNILDRISTRFGIRDLQMLANPESADGREYVDYSTGKPVTIKLPQPPPPRKYLMQINGRRIFAQGANWLPCDLLFGRARKPAYEHLIRLAARANFNLFRVWGGGLIDKEEFFDLCDRYGIMLFQEFPNAGPRLPETDEALAITARETRQILPLLVNHPCIVRYGGGNEWYRTAQDSRQMAQLRNICNDFDPTRPYHDPDPEVIAQRHGPHWYDHAQHYRTYNTGRPLTAGPDDPLEWTEYGASGASSVETLKRIMPPESLWPVRDSDPHWIWHKAFRAFGAGNWLAPAEFSYLFGDPPDLETMVRCSQFVQAEGLRYANQAMRRRKWHRSACAFWTFNEPWPNAAHGCVVEFYGRPKMAYYYAKQSYAPVDISAVYGSLSCNAGKPMDVQVWVTNDGPRQFPDRRWRYRIYDTRGRLQTEHARTVTIPAEASAEIGKVDWAPPADMQGEAALLCLDLLDAAGGIAARNLYTFGIDAAPPLAALLRAAATSLRVRRLTPAAIEVENAGPHPALFVELQVGALEGARSYLEDNYFFLAPAERRRIAVTCITPERRTAPAVAVEVRAWNSDSIRIDI